MPVIAIESVILIALFLLLLNEIFLRTRSRPVDVPDDRTAEHELEIDRLNERIRNLEKIITDPDETLRRDIDKL